jgi:hypothetical protein
MGIVATAPEYRGRGLQTRLVEQFRARLRQRGCLLSHIQGIPHFYRRYGYEHALPLEGGLRLALCQAPPYLETTYSLRPATRTDWGSIRRLHAETAGDLTIRAERDESIWAYLFDHGPTSETACEDWVVTGGDGSLCGYLRLPRQHFGEELTVNEASRLGFDAAQATLAHLARLATERGKPGVRLNLHRGSTLMRLARDLGAQDLGDYGWQIHVPDYVALFEQLRPLFEQRLADSPFAGLTREVRINRYVQTIALDFRSGRLEGVRDLGATLDLGIRIPANHLTQLLFGWLSLDDLRAAHPEIQIASIEKMLVDTLLPKVEGFLYTIY